MFKSKRVFPLLLAAAVLLVSCSQEVANVDLKSSLDQSVKQLAAAADEINASPEFAYLGMVSPAGAQYAAAQVEGLPEVDSIKVIKLADISGVYEYAWTKTKSKNILKMFTRVADSSILVVKLPSAKVKATKSLFGWNKQDSTLTNNFEGDVTDYLYYRDSTGLIYKIDAGFKLDGNSIGNLNVNNSVNKVNGHDYTSTFTLANGFVVSRTENSGDTAVSVYAISKDGVNLYEEKVSSYLTGDSIAHREKAYSLTIGNVQVVRTSGQDASTALVYVDGVLQANAKVSLGAPAVPSVSTGNNMGNNNMGGMKAPGKNDRKTMAGKNREITITLEDGTTIVMSELLNKTIDSISTIFDSVNQANFTTQIVDKIAKTIYISK